MRNAHDLLQTTKRKYFLFAMGYKLSPCPEAVKGSTFDFPFLCSFVSPWSKMRPERQRPMVPVPVCVSACCTEVTPYTEAILLGLKNNIGMERESYGFSNIFS